MKRDFVAELWKKLKPYVARDFPNVTGGKSGGAGALSAHDLDGPFHAGTLDPSQAPWVAEDLADHTDNANAHHPKVHGITGSDHTVSGLAMDVVGLTGTNVLGVITPSSNPGTNTKLLKSASDGSLTIPTLIATTEVSTPIVDSAADLTLNAGDDVILAPTGDINLSPGGNVYAGKNVGIMVAIPTVPLDVAGDSIFTGDMDVTGTVDAGTKVVTPLVDTPLVSATAADLVLTAAADIMLDPTGEVRLANGKTIQTDNFASQLTGWRHTYEGELDTRYIQADQLKIRLLIADLQQALAGSQIITKSITTVASDVVLPYPGDSIDIEVDDLPSADGMAVFEASDYVQLCRFSRSGGGLEVLDAWGTVSSYADLSDKRQQWTWTRIGTNPNATVASVGTRQVANTTGTSSTVTKVTGTSSGHLMLTLIVTDRDTAITPPSGWTLLSQQTTTGMKAALYYKFAGGSEPANYAWAFDSSGENMVSLYAYSGVHNHASFYTTLFTGESDPLGSDSIEIGSIIGASSQGDMIIALGGTYAPFEDIEVETPEDMSELLDEAWNGLTSWAADWKLSSATSIGSISALLIGAAEYVVFALNLLPTFTLDATTGFAEPGTIIDAGSFAQDYGVSGDGWHEITAVDGIYGSNSPYSRVVSWTGHPATGAVVRTQDGNLKGLFGAGNEYGFYGGAGVADTNHYLRLSNLAALFNNISLFMYISGVKQIALDPSYGIDLRLAAAADTLTALTWRETPGSGDPVVKMDAFDGGDATQFLIQMEAIDASPTSLMELRASNNVGTSQASLALDSGATTDTSEANLIANDIGIGSVAETDSVTINLKSGGKFVVDGDMGVGVASPTAVLDVGDRATFRSGASGTGGAWFASSDGTQRSFVGLHSDSGTPVVGIFNNGWRLTVDSNGYCQFSYMGEAWQNLSFNTGWSSYGGSYGSGQYKRVGDLVYLRGVIKRTSGSETTIAVLPSGYRPSAWCLFGVHTSALSAAARIDISTNGSIVLVGGGVDYVQLDGLVFSTI